MLNHLQWGKTIPQLKVFYILSTLLDETSNLSLLQQWVPILPFLQSKLKQALAGMHQH